MIAIYERVSSESQNLDSQHADLLNWATRQKEPVTWYDDKFTGKTMDRPGFQTLLKAIRDRKVTTLVVYRLDRLGRTASGLTALFDELQKLKVNFVSLKDGIDLGTPAGRLMANVIASVAAYETEIRSERTKAGIAAAKANGKTWGGSKKGRKLKRPGKTDQLVKKLHADKVSISEIARLTSLSRPTIYAILKG